MSDRYGWAVLAVIFIVFVAIIAALVGYESAATSTCQSLGWQGGSTKGWFVGYCFESNEGNWRYQECDLQYVLSGACEPMWPDAE